jgi:hypothetical protein
MSRRKAGGTSARFVKRGPWEAGATATIAAGVAMLLQPYSMGLFTYSFAVIVVGTVGFVIVSHFPE